jgi:hypothetical protein
MDDELKIYVRYDNTDNSVLEVSQKWVLDIAINVDSEKKLKIIL